MYYIKYTIFVYVYIQTLRIRMYLKNREKTQKKEKKLKKKKVGGACDTPSAAPPPPPTFHARHVSSRSGGAPDWSPISYSGS